MALQFRLKDQTIEESSAVDVVSSLASGDVLIVLSIVGATTTARTGGVPVHNATVNQDFTQAGTTQAGTAECSSELWYLFNPNLAGSTRFVAPNSGLLTIRLIVSYYTGTGAEFDQVTQTGTSVQSPSLTLNNVPAGAAVVDVFGSGYKDVATASDTLLYANDEGAWTTHAQYQIQPTTGSQTFTWTNADSDDVAFIMASFKETGGLNLALTGVSATG